jgi:hypothetical protein
LNNLPQPWSPAGNNNSIIGCGVGPAETIFIAASACSNWATLIFVLTPPIGYERRWGKFPLIPERDKASLTSCQMEDYLVVNPDNGSVRVWWNYGPDSSSVNG